MNTNENHSGWAIGLGPAPMLYRGDENVWKGLDGLWYARSHGTTVGLRSLPEALAWCDDMAEFQAGADRAQKAEEHPGWHPTGHFGPTLRRMEPGEGVAAMWRRDVPGPDGKHDIVEQETRPGRQRFWRAIPADGKPSLHVYNNAGHAIRALDDFNHNMAIRKAKAEAEADSREHPGWEVRETGVDGKPAVWWRIARGMVWQRPGDVTAEGYPGYAGIEDHDTVRLIASGLWDAVPCVGQTLSRWNSAGDAIAALDRWNAARSAETVRAFAGWVNESVESGMRVRATRERELAEMRAKLRKIADAGVAMMAEALR